MVVPMVMMANISLMKPCNACLISKLLVEVIRVACCTMVVYGVSLKATRLLQVMPIQTGIRKFIKNLHSLKNIT